MRRGPTFAILTAVACLTASCGTAYDEPQPWCSIQSLTGSQQCFYRTREECMATISGLGGVCVQNSEPTGTNPRRRVRKRTPD
jgi:hypothetical protein